MNQNHWYADRLRCLTVPPMAWRAAVSQVLNEALASFRAGASQPSAAGNRPTAITRVVCGFAHSIGAVVSDAAIARPRSRSRHSPTIGCP